MSIAITLKLNNAAKTVLVEHIEGGRDGQGAASKPAKIVAQAQTKYEFIEDSTGFAPENIATKRSGNDLLIAFEGGDIDKPDLIIEDYYDDRGGALIGQAENGNWYDYVPESGDAADAVSVLDNMMEAGQALGGDALSSGAFWPGEAASAIPAWVAGLPILGLLPIIGGGGPKNSPPPPPSTGPAPTPDTTPPTAPNPVVTDDVGNRRGQIGRNEITDDNQPSIHGGGATPGDVITVYDGGTVLGTTVVDSSGNWTFTPSTPLVDGPHSITVTAKDPAGNVSSPSASIPFVVDASAPLVVAGQNFHYGENQAVGAQVAMATATDAVGVTQWRFDNGTQVSSDGYFAIDNTGKITLTAAGAAAVANDFEVGSNSFTLGVQAGDAAGNWSPSTNVSLNVSNVNEAPALGFSGTVSSIEVGTATAGMIVTDANGTDPDAGDVLGYRLTTNVGGYYAIDPTTGVVALTQAGADLINGGGTLPNVQVTVADGGGLTGTGSVAIGTGADSTTPVIIAGQTFNYAENQVTGAEVATATATDAVGVTQWRFDNGTQVSSDGYYAIDNAGKITLSAAGAAAAANDFEVGSNSFTLGVQAGDAAGNWSPTTSVSLNVTNVNEAPVISSNGGGTSAAISVAENQTTVATVTSTDVDGPSATYSISGGADASKFTIDANTGVLTFVSAPNYESPTDNGLDNVYDVQVTVSDGSLTDVQDIAVTVSNVNEAPVATDDTVTTNEDNALSIPVATLLANDTDVDGDTLTITSVQGATHGTVSLSGGNVTFTPDADYNGPASFTYTVSDGNGLTSTATVNISVNPVNDPAVIGGTTTGTVIEAGGVANGTAGTPTATGTLTSTDVDNPANSFTAVSTATNSTNGYGTYTMTAGGVWNYTLNNNNAAVQALNVGGTLTDTFTVTSVDGTSQVVTVTINGSNDSASISGPATGSVTEDGTQTAGGTLVVADVDAGQANFQTPASLTGTYGTFTFNATTGVWGYTLNNGAANVQALAAGQQVTDTLTVTSNDGTATQNIVVTINGTNDAPVITSNGGGTSAAISVAENQTVVTTVTSTDVDGDAPVYSISGGADASKFIINSSTGVLTFVTAPNYESPTDAGASNVYDVQVTVSDGSLTDVQDIAVTVSNVNEAPSLTFNGTVSSIEVGTATAGMTVTDANGTDPDASDVLVYSLTNDPDGYYAIDPNTGVVTLTQAGADLINGGGTLPNVQVTVTDVSMLTATGSVAIGTGVDTTAPNVDAGQSFHYTENQTTGAQVATATATDAVGVTQWRFDNGMQVSTDGYYAIDNAGKITLTAAGAAAAANDYEVGSNSFTLGVQAGDAAGNWSPTTNVSLNVTNVNEAPVATNDTATTNEDTALIIPVATLLANDTDVDGDTLTITSVQGATHGTVSLSGGNVTFTPDADYNGPASFTYTVIDGNGLTSTATVNINVNPVNDPAVIGGTKTGTVIEAGGIANGTAGTQTATGTLTSADVDNPANTFTASSGSGTYGSYTMTATGEWSYALDNNNAAVQALNAGDTLSDAFTVTSVDGTSQVVTVTINGSNDSATISGQATGSVTEDGTQTAGGTLVVSDVDAGQADFQTPTSLTGIYGTFTFNAATGVWGYTLNNGAANVQALAAGQQVTDTLAVTSNDGTATQNVTVTITGTNDAPVITSNGGGSTASISVAENQTAVTTVTSTDVDGPSVTYSISGGADASKFTIDANTGVLTFVSAPNFESPTDAGGNNVYDVQVTVSDGALTDVQDIAVTVTNVNETPSLTFAGTVQNIEVGTATAGMTVTDANGTDPDAGDVLTYSLTTNVGGYYAIDANTGVVTLTQTGANLVNSGGTLPNVQVTVTDAGGLTGTGSVAIGTGADTTAPTVDAGQSFNYAENQTAGAQVATATANDAVGVTQWRFDNGTQVSSDGYYAIDNAGKITLTAAGAAAAANDYEVGSNSFTLGVQAGDAAGNWSAVTNVSLNVTNVNETPVATNDTATTNEDNALIIPVATLLANDTDVDGNALTITSVQGATHGTVSLAGGNVTFTPDADYNGPASFTYTVSDGNGLTSTATVNVTISPVNDPAIISGPATGSVTEDGAQTAGGTLAVTDVDAGQANFQTPASLAGTYGTFTFNATTGVWGYTLNNGAANVQALAAGQQVNDTLTVKSADGTATQNIVVTINGTNDAPVIMSNGGGSTASISVAENQTAVTTVTSTDVDGPSATYSISGGADASLFTIDANTGVLTFVTAPNFESPTDTGGNNVYDVQVTVSDGSLSDIQNIAVTVTNINEAPSLAFNGTVSSIEVGTATAGMPVTDANGADPDAGDVLVYSLTTNVGGYYAIDANTGMVTLTQAGADLINTGGTLPNVQVTVTDAGGLTGTGSVAIGTGADTTAPTVNAGQSFNYAENQAAGTELATATATDAIGVTQWRFDNGTQVSSDGYYAIDDAGKITLTAAGAAAAANDYEVGSNSFTLGVQAGDAAGNWSATTNVSLNVTNINEAPVITSNGGGSTASISVAENQTAVTTVTSTDVDGPSVTYSISGGADASLFTIDANTGVLTFVTAPNFESPTDAGGNNVYDVQVTVSDGALTDVQDIAVTVTNVNEAPVITSNGGGSTASISVAENQTAVTTVTSTDVDGPSVTYSISGGADASKFTIDANTGVLTFVSAPNFESPTDAGGNNVYDVQVTVSDGALTDVQDIAVTVTNVNETPSLTFAGTVQNIEVGTATAGMTVTDANGTDPDAGDVLVYSLTTNVGGYFAIDPNTGVVTLTQAGADLINTGGTLPNVQVTVTDGGLLTGTGSVAVGTGADTTSPTVDAGQIYNYAENQATGAEVATATATDAVGVTQWRFDNGTQVSSDGYYAIDNAGKITLTTAGAAAAANDYETGANNFTLGVQAGDAAGNWSPTTNVSLNVTNVNEAPVATNDTATTNEDTALIIPVATLLANDTDVDGDTLTITSVQGATHGTVSLSGGNVTFTPDADYNGPASFTYTVIDGNGLTSTATVNISVNPVNDPAVIGGTTTGTVIEAGGVANGTAGTPTATGTLTSTDVDNPANSFTAVSTATNSTNGYGTYTMTAGGVWNYTLNNNNAAVQALNVGGTLTDTFTVTSVDGTSQVVTVTINGSNDSASISGPATGSVTEDGTQTAGGTLVVADVDAGQANFQTPASLTGTYGTFTFNATTGVWGYTLNNGAANVQALAAGQQVTDTLTVTSNDGTATQNIVVTINGTNDAPVITSNGGGTSAAISVAENQTVVTTVTSTDVDGDAPVYSISGGADASKFIINSSTGVLTFVTAPNYESPTDAGASNVYDVQVTVSDGSLTDVQDIAVTVTNVNEAPSVSFSGTVTSIEAGTATAGMMVTDANGTDPDAGAVLSYSLTTNAGGYYAINATTGAVTLTQAGADLVNAGGTLPTVQVTVTDQGGLTGAGSVAVGVGADVTAPVVAGGQSFSYAENQASGALLGTVTASDAVGVTQWRFANGLQTTNDGYYAIDNAGKITLTAAGASAGVATNDYETSPNSFTLSVQAGDTAGNWSTPTNVALAVTNVNEAPVITSNGGGTTAAVSVPENQVAVTTVTSTDVDAGSTLSYSISGGADASKFTINANTGVLTFVSAPNYESPTDVGGNNVYDVQVTVSDGSLTDVQDIAVTVTNVNEAPVATNDTATTNEDTAVVIAASSLLANDADVDGDTLTITSVQGAVNGTASLSGGNITFTPNANYNGPASFTYTVSDGNGGTSTATVNLTVNAVNDAPVITSNGGGTTAAISVAENQTAVTTVTSTDVDGPSATYTISGGADASKFAIDAVTGVLTFVSAPNYESPTDNGLDNVYDVQVTVSDGSLTDVQDIAVTVSNVNEAPVATDDTVTTNEDNALIIPVATLLANDTDVDGDTLTITSVQGATHGTVSLSGGNVTFTPDADYNGPASFIYTVIDGNGLTSTATVNINVNPVNDPATISGPVTGSVTEDGTQTAGGTLVVADVDAGQANFQTPASLTGTYGTFTFNATTGVWGYTLNNGAANVQALAAGQQVTDTLTVTSNDGTATQNIVVTINGTNDAPVITSNGGGAPATISIAENQTAVTTVTSTDVDGPTATYSISGGADASKFTIDATTGVLTFVTAPNFELPTDVGANNVYDVQVTVSDGSLTDVQNIAVTVTNINEAPSLTFSGTVSSIEVGTATAGMTVTDANGTDPDAGDVLVYSLTTNVGGYYAIDPNTGVVTLTQAGADLINTGGTLPNVQVTVTDGGLLTGTGSVAIGTGADTTAPVITAGQTFNYAENQAAGAEVATATATDAVGVTQWRFDNGTQVSSDGYYAIDNTGKITLTTAGAAAAANDYETGANNFALGVQAGDAAGNWSSTTTVSLNVTNVNEAPVITSNGGGTSANVTVAENQTAVTTVTSTDVDAGSTLSYSISGGADASKFTINANTGVLTFVSAPNYESPTDVGGNNVYDVQVTVSDGSLTDVQDIAVTVTNVNEAPVASNDVASTNEDTAVVIAASSLLANDTDVDGNTLTITSVQGAVNGTVSLSGGNITFTPNANYNGPASFTYTVSDGNGGTSTATVNVTVNAVNDAPVATNDTATTNEDTAVVIAASSLLANDTDVDGNTLTITSVQGAVNGTVSLSGGNITFTPNANYNGPASFTYTVSDGNGGTSTATVNVTVNAVNDAPVNTLPATFTTNEDTSVRLAGLSISDVDAASGIVTVTLSVASGTLTAASAGSVTVAGSGTGSIVLSGTVANINTYLGTAANQPNYVPVANANGNVTLTMVTNDGGNTGSGGALSDTDTSTITITPVNDAPVATNDTATTNEDTAVVIAASSLLANDTDVDGNTLTITSVQGAVNGTVSLSGGNITFTPNANYNGPASFTYTVSDGNGGTSTATVNVTVNAVNDAPVATNDTATTNEDTAVVIAASSLLANDTDVDGNTLTITSVQGAVNGTVSLSGGNITFTPNANYNGPASFTYTVSDGNGGTSTATVNVTVNAVNDAPVATNDTATTNEDTAVVIAASSLLANDTDVDGNTLTITSVQGAVNGTVSLSGGNITFTPNANYNGPASFTYTVSDGNGGTSTATVNLTVNAVNDAPVATNDTATTNEDTAVVIASSTLLANDTDVDGNPLTITSVQGAVNGTVSLSGGNITFTPNANYNGPASFTYTVSDGNGGTSTATVNVTVNAVNDAPVATNDTATTNEDTAVVIAASSLLANDTDVDGNTLTITSVQGAVNGTVSLSGGNITFTPNANYNGPASFTYTVNDGNGGTSTATVNVTVNAVNDAPVNTLPATFTTNEDTSVRLAGLSISDVDAASGIVTVTLSVASGTLTAASAGSVTVAGSGTGSIVLSGTVANINTYLGTAANQPNYVPVANANGNVTLTMVTNDGGNTGSGGALSDTDTSTITITPVNDAPVATNDTATTNEDTAVVIAASSLLANDTDVDGNTLTITSVQGAVNGTVSLSGGNITFTPNANYNGPASFTYTVSDGNGGTSTATVNVTVNAVNDAPVATNDTATTNEDTAVVIAASSLLANDTDVDGNTLTITSVQGAVNGTVSLSGGNITFTPNANYNGPASFTYTVSDGNGGTSTATVNVTVNAVNDAPVATNDTATTNEDTAVVIAASSLLANDTDVDGNTLTITSVQGAVNGTVSLSGGNITFTPNANYNGPASFTYTVSDGNGGTSTATVNLTVNAVNDAPVNTLPATFTTNEDTSVKLAGLSISDVDAASGTVTVTLSVASGTLTAASAGSVTVTGSGTGAIVLSGTVANINTYLGTAANQPNYVPVANANGNVTLTMVTNDGGNTGSGGALSDTDTSTITINPVNDAAIIGGTTSGSVTEAGGVANGTAGTPTATGTLTSTDIDNPANTFTAVATATNSSNGYGTYTMTSGGVWTYALNNNNASVQALNLGATLTDSFTVSSIDGTTQLISITINGRNDAPVIVTPIGTVVVSEEGLTGGIVDTSGSTDTTNATTASGTVTFSDIDNSSASSFAMTLSGPAAGAVKSGGLDVTWTWDSASRTLTGATTAGTVMTVVATTATVSGSNFNVGYTVNLLKPVDHATANVEDELAINFQATVSDGVNTSAAQTLTVKVEDDMPATSSGVQNVQVGTTDTNITVILDLSGSMNTGTRLQNAKNAVNAMLDQYDQYGDVRVQLVVFGGYAGSNPWMSVADAKAYVTALSSTTLLGGTNYDDALARAMAGWTLPGRISGAENVSYFLTDGVPTYAMGDTSTLTGSRVGDGSNVGSSADNGIQAAEETLWKNFLVTNAIKSYAFNIDGTAGDTTYLNPIAYDGTTSTDTNGLGVTSATLQSELNKTVPKNTTSSMLVTGNAATGTAGFGADGGLITALTLDGTTYSYNATTGAMTMTGTNRSTYDSTTHVVTVTTLQSATFELDFDNGAYRYITNGTSSNYTEQVGFTAKDNDGDSVTAKQTLIISRMEAVDDVIITNLSSPLTIAPAILTANDTSALPASITSVQQNYGATVSGTLPTTVNFSGVTGNQAQTVVELNDVDGYDLNDERALAVDLSNRRLFGATTDVTSPGTTLASKLQGNLFAQSDVDYVKVRLSAGEKLTIDFDSIGTTPIDGVLQVQDSSGNVLVTLDDLPSGTTLDNGSEHVYEPLIVFTAPNSGIFYIRVSAAVGNGTVANSGAYNLWLSVDTAAATEKQASFDYTLATSGADDTGTVTIIQTTSATLTGTSANETLIGKDGQTNTLLGLDGNDVLIGGNGADTLDGGNGTDAVNYLNATAGVSVSLGVSTAQNTGGAGSDTLSNIENLIGSAFNDTLTGNGGANVIFGGNGNDTIDGGAGDDILWGQLGNDTLTGGLGADFFNFASAGSADADIIKDFVHGTDKIGLDNAFFAALGIEGTLSATAFQSNVSGSAASTVDTRIIYDQSNGQLWYDADGSGTGAATLIATIYSSGTTPATGVDANDFKVI